jgi:PleD family two-component response regulator
LTVSAGVAAADRSASAEQLLWAADGAVYEAKAQGRDRIIVVPPPQPVAA